MFPVLEFDDHHEKEYYRSSQKVLISMFRGMAVFDHLLQVEEQCWGQECDCKAGVLQVQLQGLCRARN